MGACPSRRNRPNRRWSSVFACMLASVGRTLNSPSGTARGSPTPTRTCSTARSCPCSGCATVGPPTIGAWRCTAPAPANTKIRSGSLHRNARRGARLRGRRPAHRSRYLSQNIITSAATRRRSPQLPSNFRGRPLRLRAPTAHAGTARDMAGMPPWIMLLSKSSTAGQRAARLARAHLGTFGGLCAPSPSGTGRVCSRFGRPGSGVPPVAGVVPSRR